VQKYGFVKAVQRYKCSLRGKQFLGGQRLDNAQIWKEYAQGKQTSAQLAERFHCSIKRIQRRIDAFNIEKSIHVARVVIVLMDTAYWGRNFGVMLFKDALSKENLLKSYVKNETNALYIQGIKELQQRCHTIKAIVCDGRKGLIQSFDGIPVQMCQFHQSAIIRIYLTKDQSLRRRKS